MMARTLLLSIAVLALIFFAASPVNAKKHSAAKFRFAAAPEAGAEAAEAGGEAAEEDAGAEAEPEPEGADGAAEGDAQAAIADEVVKRIQDGNKAAQPAEWGTTEEEMTPTHRGQFIPYGKTVPQSHGEKYYTATGHQECNVCKKIIDNADDVGVSFYNLCNELVAEEKSMCFAQQKVLQNCPEFANNWCYQDLGGTQQLRSPCPKYLTCHYCLGVNPLHCQDTYKR